jgi:hypothetical protein
MNARNGTSLTADGLAEWAPAFWEKVQRSEGCWIWRGTERPDGYGWLALRRRERGQLPHRVAFALAHGALPSGKHVHHICGVRLCVRPDHLMLVAPAEHPFHDARNVARANRERGTCRHGHAFTEMNTYVDNTGSRHCRACHRETELRRYYRIKATKVAA